MIHNVRHAVRTLTRGDEAQDLLEYALLAALIVVVAIGAVMSVGTTISTVFWTYISGATSGI
jgi:Flp pilus assembly pilin Flp